MLKIKILAIGSIKKDYFKNAIDDYLKRLSVYAKITIEELKSEPFFENSDINKIKILEGERVTKHLKKYSQDRIVLLHEKSHEMNSLDFSEFIHEDNQGELIFVIGGALGLSQDLLDYPGAKKLSLSQMTFPHEMARLVLFEQIYRAIAIEKNKKYHY
jgi:23S rRNA (pseudouridine1915-N3)-methyltransferase